MDEVIAAPEKVLGKVLAEVTEGAAHAKPIWSVVVQTILYKLLWPKVDFIHLIYCNFCRL